MLLFENISRTRMQPDVRGTRALTIVSRAAAGGVSRATGDAMALMTATAAKMRRIVKKPRARRTNSAAIRGPAFTTRGSVINRYVACMYVRNAKFQSTCV